ncbi:hypothetical protein [Pukyongiella litopenaei]|uniref:Uncharacterized protein n=1 Tax=Pukyongiella litopenaei TaxID=2605946 RepID=A0A2S0MMS3_9RHOB|nr:hypothetical protein [Pukyongiella litopenaei]AVO36983.1 hypothetical protein C6Y53_04225 [Pukyongiella litopenaei]
MNWFSYGAWGAIGLIAGLALVTYAKPDTTEGVGLLLLICLAVSLVVRGLWGWVRQKRAAPESEENEDDAEPDDKDDENA